MGNALSYFVSARSTLSTLLGKIVWSNWVRTNPFFDFPIAWRIISAFGLIAIIVSIALGNVGMKSTQLISRETLIYQHLIHSYSSLDKASTMLQQLDITIQETLNDASKANPSAETLNEDQLAFQSMAQRYSDLVEKDIPSDLLERNVDQATLLIDTGRSNYITQQSNLTSDIIQKWHTYLAVELQVLDDIKKGETKSAQFLAYNEGEYYLADDIGAVRQLITFNSNLLLAIYNSVNTEENNLLITLALTAFFALAATSLVGFLMSGTLVPRLRRLRVVVQSIEKGQFDARIAAKGRDEIAAVSTSVNTMLDTIVGLLEETKKQRDALESAQELQKLHAELQTQHEALNEANARLEALAITDPLTGMPNHRALISRIDDEMVYCQTSQGNCAILFIDLDRFKKVNDTWGHRAGDSILREFAQRLRNNVRQEDFVGRYGGEEFTILLLDVDQPEALEVAERVRQAVAAIPCYWEEEDTHVIISIPITCSIGVAVFPLDGVTREALIEQADRAMYLAKQNGRNRVCISVEEAEPLEATSSSTEDIQREATTVQVLAVVASVHDNETSAHAQRMIQFAEATAQMLERSEEEVQLIRLAALLHDIGKIGIPDAILHKPGPLTSEEWEIMRRHAEIGQNILMMAGGKFELLSRIVVAHHERWDGTGYPYGLKQEAIPLGARILTVVDSFDAMTSDRAYRKAMSEQSARAELQKCTGTQFDPTVVEAFLKVLDKKSLDRQQVELEPNYPVQLSNTYSNQSLPV